MKIKTTLEKVNSALNKIQEVGGTVSVNGSKGGFDVKGVEGRFDFDQDTEILTVVIDDKPWLASEAMIEREINKFFA